MSTVSRLIPKMRSLGPYLLMELLLPGGTLIALILWLSQGMSRGALTSVDQPVIAATQVEKMVSAVEIRGVREARA